MKLSLRKYLLTSTFAFFCACSLFAQKPITKKDTVTVPVDSSRFFFFTENQFDYGNKPNPFGKISNNLDRFQDYKPRHAFTGNAGAPEKLLFLPQSPDLPFRRGPNQFAAFGYYPANRKFYTSEKPYTRVFYLAGQKKELNVSVVHAHPFGKNCNVAFGFDRIRSTGFYRRQNTNNTSVNLNGWYRSPGRRYAMLSDIYWTTNYVAENGGISRDSSFEFANQLDRQLVGINLSAAQTRQRIRGAWVKQYWSIGPVVDTLSEKTDSTEFRTKIQPAMALVHTFSISDEMYQYLDEDPAAGFYSTIYSDSLETNDSTYLYRMENGLWIEQFNFRKGSLRKFYWKAGARFEFGEYKNDSIYRNFQNLYADGQVNFDPKKKALFRSNVNGWYVLTGNNQGDFLVRANAATASLSNMTEIRVNLESSLMRPALLYTNYTGNHFRWENDFSQAGINSANLQVSTKVPGGIVLLSATYSAYYKPLYFDSTLLPAQYNGTVSIPAAKLVWAVNIVHFHAISNFTWNSITEESPIRLPQFILRESIYFDFHVFRKAMHVQAGLDATWFSAYFADAYNPNIAQFYIQNTKEIGNYLFLDPWVSLKIKSVRVFIKADHVNAGLFGRNYFLLPHYPANDLAMKLGISWAFND